MTNQPWTTYRLADDPSTYGTDAGKLIVTTADGETEITGVIPDEGHARLIAAAPALEAALLDALPYVEDVLSNPEQLACFKRGVVQAHVKAIRAALQLTTKE